MLKIKNWLFLFISSLLLGGLTVIITNLVLGWDGLTGGSMSLADLLAAAAWLFIVGLMFSVLSQMGFFAYLTLHRFGMGFFKSPRLWNAVQLVLIAFTFFDLVYLRYIAFREGGETWASFLPLPLILLLISMLTAYIKVKLTNHTAFIPTLFFMFVVTSVEVVPAIIQNDSNWVMLMLVPLIVCNAWQILILQSLIQEKKKGSV